MLKWNCTKEELETMASIAYRAAKLSMNLGVNYTKQEALMDLNACHANGCPLRLKDLLEADEGDFCHDVFGIRRHLNRSTGQLENCFLPRYSAKQGGSDA